jgi:preprotein translocase subunit YajC
MHLNSFSAILAQAAPAAGGQPQGPSILLFILPMFVIMYFMIIRPQQKRAKEQAKMLEALKSGDRVGTSSGIIGTVISVKDKVVTLRSGDSKLEVSKSAVTEILEAANPSAN